MSLTSKELLIAAEAAEKFPRYHANDYTVGDVP